jgi:hypothetical protein
MSTPDLNPKGSDAHLPDGYMSDAINDYQEVHDDSEVEEEFVAGQPENTEPQGDEPLPSPEYDNPDDDPNAPDFDPLPEEPNVPDGNPLGV